MNDPETASGDWAGHPNLVALLWRAMSETATAESRLTAKGRATRARIVEVAARLVFA
jgi:hypothetical protein